MNEESPVHKQNGDTVPLKSYIERILDEREKAVQVAYRNMELRLDKLNELRAEVQQDRGQFIRLDVFDEKHNQLRRSMSELEDKLELQIATAVNANAARIGNLESWRLKATGVALVMIPLAGLIGAAIMKAFGG